MLSFKSTRCRSSPPLSALTLWASIPSSIKWAQEDYTESIAMRVGDTSVRHRAWCRGGCLLSDSTSSRPTSWHQPLYSTCQKCLCRDLSWPRLQHLFINVTFSEFPFVLWASTSSPLHWWCHSKESYEDVRDLLHHPWHYLPLGACPVPSFLSITAHLAQLLSHGQSDGALAALKTRLKKMRARDSHPRSEF